MSPDRGEVSRRSVLLLSGLTLAGAAAGSAGCSGSPPPAPQPSGRTVPTGDRRDYSEPATYDWAEATYRATVQPGRGEGNDAGALAWDEAYALESYLPMYRATADPGYLDKLVEHGYRVLDARDDQRRRPDYRGLTGPVWGAGAPYTVASLDLLSASGVPTLRLYSSTGSDAILVDVRPRGGGVFDLTVDAGPGGPRETIRGLSTDSRSPASLVRRLTARAPTPTGLTARDLRPTDPGPVELQPVQRATMTPARYVFLVHTGMICAPLAGFAALVRGDRRLAARYAAPARDFLSAARAAMAFHEEDWRQVSERIGLYATARGAPIPLDGTYVPHNQYLAAARVRARLFRCTKDPAEAASVSSMTNTFLSDLSAGHAPVWPYYWRGSQVYSGYGPADRVSRYTPRAEPNQALEDISHGALDVESLVAAHDAGIGVPDDHLRRLAGTFRRRVTVPGPAGVVVAANSLAAGTGTGSHELAVPRWAGLARWDRRVFTRSLALFNRRQPDPAHGQVLASTAKLVAAR